MKNKVLVVIIMGCLIMSNCATRKNFTIAVLPDTQGEVGSKTDMIKSQVNWIAANKNSISRSFSMWEIL